MRKAGILMAISSLPSSYGIGDFGPSAYEFVDCIESASIKVWQVLPLNALGYGNSPYQPYSSNAMDELYISLDLLKEEGLIQEVLPFNESTNKVDYEATRTYKHKYLLEAFYRYIKDNDYDAFVENYWVTHYAIYMALRKQNNDSCWNTWPDDQKFLPEGRTYDLSHLIEEIEYQKFVQFILFKQWKCLKKYANDKGIELIGDLPIYVGLDSEDVYSNKSDFLLDEAGHPTFVAGVPPDYFSKTGQRWGNPLYNWEKMRNEGFPFWIHSLNYSKQLFDKIRIDHFRGFDTYWKIPASCETAIDGEWAEAPGYDLFDTLAYHAPGLDIIAEDLGDLREEVLTLRDHYQFPGMKITQFTFYPTGSSSFDDREHMIVYTGTHDNQTIQSYLHEKGEAFRIKTIRYLKKNKCWKGNLSNSMNYYALNEIANTTILPIQDILGYDDTTRMNTPGTVGNPNWQFKLVDFEGFKNKLPQLKKWIQDTNRS